MKQNSRDFEIYLRDVQPLSNISQMCSITFEIYYRCAPSHLRYITDISQMCVHSSMAIINLLHSSFLGAQCSKIREARLKRRRLIFLYSAMTASISGFGFGVHNSVTIWSQIQTGLKRNTNRTKKKYKQV